MMILLQFRIEIKVVSKAKKTFILTRLFNWEIHRLCTISNSSTVSASNGLVYPLPLLANTQEVMENPHVAADGFTYEAEALRGWLDSGHDTSPMTNLRLDHQNLVPNRALRSVIQEWLQQH